jgi:protein phosphatase 2C family protein 2/3
LFSTSNDQHYVLGPVRVNPGRLSVSRTFGDIEAKFRKFGGVPGIIIAEPDIKKFPISEDKDFILMGCDGIFDQLTNKEAVDIIW